MSKFIYISKEHQVNAFAKSLETRRYFQKKKIDFVKYIAHKYELDLTVAFVKKIMISVFDKAISENSILENFPIKKGRTAKHKSTDMRDFNYQLLASEFDLFTLQTLEGVQLQANHSSKVKL